MSYFITESCRGCTTCVAMCPTSAISGERKQPHSIDPEKCIHCGACGRICPADAVLDSLGNQLFHVKRSQLPKPEVNLAECFSCENCISVCPSGCLVMSVPEEGVIKNKKNQREDYPFFAGEKKCISCGWCAEACGFDAIKMKITGVQSI